MLPKHLCTLIHIRTKDEVGTVKKIKPSEDNLLTIPRRCFFVDPFCHICFRFIFVMLSCLFLAAFKSPAGKRLTSYVPSLLCFVVFCYLTTLCHWSGILLSCIDS